ncbi:TMPRSS15 (predicted), partial [Pycnogonum litorale]
YDNVFKVFPLLKLDRMASIQTLNGMINEEEEKLPHRIILHWPEGDEVKNNYRLPAGKTIGAIKVEIANCRGDLISKLAGSSQRKLLVELRIVWHSPSGDVTVVQHVCQHAKNWPYWFRKMENIKNLGSHTLILQAILHETGTHVLCGKSLPSAKVNFVVVEAEPEKFSVGVLDGPFRVGVPFSIPLEFQDKFGNPTKPTSAMKPNLEADGLKLILGGTVTKSTTLYMHDIRAIGKVDNNTGKNFGLTVIIPQLESGFHSQNLKIRLLPGPPEKINVDRYPEIVENGSSVSFDVQVNDIGGNPSIENKAVIVCNFSSSQQEYRDVNLPKYSSDLSKGGHVTLTGNPIKFLSLKDPLTVKATFSIQNFKGVADVTKEFTIVPSKRVTTMKLTYFNEDTKSTVEVIRGKDILVPCGYIMTGIELQVYDEGGREVELSASLMSKLKLNWMSSAAQKNRTSGGKLPDIVAPKMAKTSQYCHVALSTDSSLVDFDFTIKTTCGQPTTLKVKLTGNNRVKVGSRLQSDLLVSLQDQYGNQI